MGNKDFTFKLPKLWKAGKFGLEFENYYLLYVVLYVSISITGQKV